MSPSLELEPVPRLRSLIRGVSLVAALSLAACSGGGGKGEVLAAQDPAAAESTTDTFAPGELPSTSETTATTVASTTTEHIETTQPPTTATPTTAYRPPTTRPPATQPPTTQAPPPPPPTTQPPRPGLRSPSGLEVGGGTAECRDVPPAPGDPGVRSGYMCWVNLRTNQNDSRPEGSGYRVSTVFTNCPENQQPYMQDPLFWRCQDTWATAEASPRNQTGMVQSRGPMYPDQRSCWIAFSRLEQYSDGFWNPVQLSEEAPQKVCVQIDRSGNVVG